MLYSWRQCRGFFMVILQRQVLHKHTVVHLNRGPCNHWIMHGGLFLLILTDAVSLLSCLDL